MPNVLFEQGLRMMIFTNDHEPMHVHVYCQGRGAVVEFDPIVKVRRNMGLTRHELRSAMTIIIDRREYLVQRWREIYEQS